MKSDSAIVRSAHVAGSDTIRLGLVGCGNRGSGACRDALEHPGPVRLVAMGDLFASRLETSLKNLQKYDDLRPRIDVPPERRFVGFDAYQKVIDSGVDLVLFATPPHFRPIHYAAAVKAGKHVFLEKPCCVDAPGYRQLLAANEVAKAKHLSVVVGLQRRHQPLYLEKIQKIRDGAVGRIRLVRTYFNMPGGREGVPKPAEMGEMEYQIRSWNLFCWLCGDHLVEQACHEIDVANWILDAHPVRANGMGARQIRSGPGTGDIYDRHMIEFEYADGTRHYCQARQQPGTWSHVSEQRARHERRDDAGRGALGHGGRHAADAARQGLQRPESLSARARRSDGQHPRRGSLSLRGRLRGHEQPDGRHGTDGDLFRKARHLGRRDPFRVAPRARPLRPGRPAARRA